MDEIRRNAERDGADIGRDRSIKRSTGCGYGVTGAVEITENVRRNLEVKVLLSAFT